MSTGYRAELHERLGSTNDEAMRRAREGDPGRLWIIARQQEQGRGRHGRNWVSPPGNLYASLLLVEPAPAGVAPQLGFVAGAALHRSVAGLIGPASAGLSLKWPNDLLLDGAKCAGILVEGVSWPGAGLRAVVIGMGVNLAHHPETALYPATDLAVRGFAVSVEDAAAALVRNMAAAIELWNRGAGFAAIRADWLARAGGVGGPVRVRLPGGERRGVFKGLAEDGSLLLDEGGVVAAIRAGDVFLGADGSAVGAGARSETHEGAGL
nr:biotin--[acetyl-CoA-carboxylase] ligase [Alsobacter ponti]